MPATVLLAAALMVQDPTPSPGPGVLLARNADTAFLLPLDSLAVDGDVKRATMISIYPSGSEAWEVVRRDDVLELDCSGRRIRGGGSTDYDLSGVRRAHRDAESLEWMALPEGYPPFLALFAIACEDAIVGGAADLEIAIPRIRAILDEASDRQNRDAEGDAT